MKFHYEQHDDPATGGILSIEAENSLAETLEIIKCFRREEFDLNTQSGALHYAACVGNPNYKIILNSARRPWFRVEDCLKPEWAKPYAEQIEQWTGWTHPNIIPDLDLTKAFARLGVWCLVERAWSEDGCIHYIAYCQGWSDWENPLQEISKKVAQHIGDVVGFGGVQPQKIMGQFGREIDNPNAGAYIPPSPKLANAAIFNKVWEWHRKHSASPMQQAYLDLSEKLHENDGNVPDWLARQGYGHLNFHSCGGFKHQSEDDEGNAWTKDKLYKEMKWEDFKILGAGIETISAS